MLSRCSPSTPPPPLPSYPIYQNCALFSYSLSLLFFKVYLILSATTHYYQFLNFNRPETIYQQNTLSKSPTHKTESRIKKFSITFTCDSFVPDKAARSLCGRGVVFAWALCSWPLYDEGGEAGPREHCRDGRSACFPSSSLAQHSAVHWCQHAELPFALKYIREDKYKTWCFLL